MSFEGYFQIICKNGHYHNEVADFNSDYNPSTWECPDCGAELAWENLVDDTNCDNFGYVELEEITSREYKTCPCCNHKEITKMETYKIHDTPGR